MCYSGTDTSGSGKILSAFEFTCEYEWSKEFKNPFTNHLHPHHPICTYLAKHLWALKPHGNYFFYYYLGKILACCSTILLPFLFTFFLISLLVLSLSLAVHTWHGKVVKVTVHYIQEFQYSWGGGWWVTVPELLMLLFLMYMLHTRVSCV